MPKNIEDMLTMFSYKGWKSKKCSNNRQIEDKDKIVVCTKQNHITIKGGPGSKFAKKYILFLANKILQR